MPFDFVPLSSDMKIVIGVLLACSALMRVNAADPWEDTLRYPRMLWWPGSLNNVISILEGDATSSNPPYHLETFEPWNHTFKQGKEMKGFHLVFARPDHVIEFRISEANKNGCDRARSHETETKRYSQRDPFGADSV
jgi:hypothetical protein